MTRHEAVETAIQTDYARASDPFALELVKNALATIADEMALTIARTARSFVVKEALDFSTALYLADGEIERRAPACPSISAPCPTRLRPSAAPMPAASARATSSS